MILRQATIQYAGYDPDDITKGSHKRVCRSCNNCGRIDWVEYCSYRSLCGSCARSGKANPNYGNHKLAGKNNPMWGKVGKNHPMFGKKQTLESRIKRSCTRQGITIEDFRGFTTKDHKLPECKCIKLNKRFIGSRMHHITKSIVVYIPHELHEHIWHNMKSGLNMGEMNVLAIQFISGSL